MEVRSRWYRDTARKINSYQDTFSKKEAKKYKLDYLLRIAGRTDQFSEECGSCQIFQQQITQQLQDLGNLSLLSKGVRQNYGKFIKSMVKHLQQEHKLVTKGQYIGIWMAIGTGIGVAIGAGMDNVGGGMPIGIGIGIAVGAYLDSKAKKEGRVI